MSVELAMPASVTMGAGGSGPLPGTAAGSGGASDALTSGITVPSGGPEGSVLAIGGDSAEGGLGPAAEDPASVASTPDGEFDGAVAEGAEMAAAEGRPTTLSGGTGVASAVDTVELVTAVEELALAADVAAAAWLWLEPVTGVWVDEEVPGGMTSTGTGGAGAGAGTGTGLDELIAADGALAAIDPLEPLVA